MKKRLEKPDMGGLLTLLLLGVFALCVLAVLLTGGDAYRRLTERDRAAWDRRTAAQYLTTRVRQSDRLGAVTVESFGGADALVLTEEIDGEPYETRIYCSDGWLRELFAAAGSEFLPEDGEPVLPAEGLILSAEGRALVAELTGPDGAVQRLTLCLRSGEGAAP